MEHIMLRNQNNKKDVRFLGTPGLFSTFGALSNGCGDRRTVGAGGHGNYCPCRNGNYLSHSLEFKSMIRT